MAWARESTYIHQRFTLRQAMIVAVLLHLVLGTAMQWRPDLLWSDPVVAVPESRPIEFRFVDVPEAAPPAETPDTDVLSDADRQAADLSPRDDASDPFSEGNTEQEVVRLPAGGEAAPEQPEIVPVVPVTPPEEVAEAPPDPEAAAEETAPPVEAEGDIATAENLARATRAQPEVEERPVETGPTEALPPRRSSLRSSLSRLDSYTQPELYNNPEGGSQFGDGIISFDTKGYDLGAYIRQILQIIERNWKNNIPPAAYLPGMSGATFVALSIERARTEAGVEVARIVVHQTWSSGKPAFDQAALLSLEISSPLPPLPSFFPYEEMTGRIGYLYNLDPSQVTFPPGHQD